MTTWLPYCGPGALPSEIWSRWNFDPLLLAGLAMLAGVAILTTRADARARLFGLGAVVALVISFVSPLCALSSALFAARTVHHVVLVAVAAPLLAWSLRPIGHARGAARMIGVLGFAVLFWAWHTPAAYGWALSNDAVYWLMQATLLVTATVFWMSVRVASAPAAVLGLLITMVQTGLLGALLVFMPDAIYAPHLLTTAAWGLTPLEDQQLAGLIMWAPAAGIYLGAALLILGRSIGPDARKARPA